MSMSVVWVDLEKAKLFHFAEDRMERETVAATRVEHHTHRIEGDERDCWPMYDAIAEKVGSAKRVLILGPGVARMHLHNRMKDKFPGIAKRVVGCERSDHPTDQQIAAYAMKYFQKPIA
jgi:hypothetical protein